VLGPQHLCWCIRYRPCVLWAWMPSEAGSGTLACLSDTIMLCSTASMPSTGCRPSWPGSTQYYLERVVCCRVCATCVACVDHHSLCVDCSAQGDAPPGCMPVCWWVLMFGCRSLAMALMQQAWWSGEPLLQGAGSGVEHPETMHSCVSLAFLWVYGMGCVRSGVPASRGFLPLHFEHVPLAVCGLCVGREVRARDGRFSKCACV
jgi:hypothetical protein